MKSMTKNRIKYFTLMLSLATSMLVLHAARAEEADPQEAPSYWTLAGRKLNRGVYNAGLGWSELPEGIQTVGNKHGVGAAATWGVLHGLGRAIQRTAVGVFEVVTFPIGVPHNFEPILEPKSTDQEIN
jgi:putative exosortase-associated protein (TIGR04073 family)